MATDSPNTLRVVFPTNEFIRFHINENSTVFSFIDIITQKMFGLTCSSIFGLKYKNGGDFFLENEKTFSNQDIKTHKFVLFFTLRFCIPTVSFIKSAKLLTIYHFYCLELLHNNTVCPSNYEKKLLKLFNSKISDHPIFFNYSTTLSEDIVIVEKRDWCFVHKTDTISCLKKHKDFNLNFLSTTDSKDNIEDSDQFDKLCIEFMNSMNDISSEMAMIGFCTITEHLEGYGFQIYDAVNSSGEICNIVLSSKGLFEYEKLNYAHPTKSISWLSVRGFSFRKQKFNVEYIYEDNTGMFNQSCLNLEKTSTTLKHSFWILCESNGAKLLTYECSIAKKFWENFTYDEFISDLPFLNKPIDHLFIECLFNNKQPPNIVANKSLIQPIADFQSAYALLISNYDRLIELASFQQVVCNWIQSFIVYKIKHNKQQVIYFNLHNNIKHCLPANLASKHSFI